MGAQPRKLRPLGDVAGWKKRPTKKIRRLSVTLCLAKKRRENDRSRHSGEQLSEALMKGESRESHRLSRILAGRGMTTRRKHLSPPPAKRQSLEERANTPEQPVDKGGCIGPRIIFGEKVQKMKSFRSVEHPRRVAEDVGFPERRSQKHRTNTDLGTKRHEEEANTPHRQSSSTSSSHFSQLCALQSMRKLHGTERRGQAGSKRNGMQRDRQVLF